MWLYPAPDKAVTALEKADYLYKLTDVVSVEMADKWETFITFDGSLENQHQCGLRFCHLTATPTSRSDFHADDIRAVRGVSGRKKRFGSLLEYGRITVRMKGRNHRSQAIISCFLNAGERILEMLECLKTACGSETRFLVKERKRSILTLDDEAKIHT